MSSPLVELFGELERIEFDPERLSDPVYLEQQLARRQGIIDKLQSLDATRLDPATRATLLECTRVLQERDRSLALALELRRNELAEKLDSLVKGRSATRGYRPAAAEAEQKGGSRIA